MSFSRVTPEEGVCICLNVSRLLTCFGIGMSPIEAAKYYNDPRFNNMKDANGKPIPRPVTPPPSKGSKHLLPESASGDAGGSSLH